MLLILLLVLFIRLIRSIDSTIDLLNVVKSNPTIDNIYRLGNYYLYYHKNCTSDVKYDFVIDSTLYNTFINRLNTWSHDSNVIECKSRTLLCYTIVLYMKRTIQDNNDLLKLFDYPGMLNDLGILYSSIDIYDYAVDVYEEALNGK
jgi:hypothetical protein